MSFDGNVELYVVFSEHTASIVDLESHNLLDFGFRQRREHYNLINTVQELRTDCRLQHLKHLVLGGFDGLSLVCIGHLREILADELRAHV